MRISLSPRHPRARCSTFRRRANLTPLLTSTAVLLLGADRACAAEAGHAVPRTNVVVIYADDLGWGDLGCYGNKKFRTPNLDRMAAEGARLTNFQSVCPVCAPSRYGLLTGRYPARGMPTNPAPDAGPDVDALGIAVDERTLGEVLQSAGYRTACIGKWHLGHKPQFLPTRHGFHEYYGILYSNDMRPVQVLDGEQVVEYPVVQATLTARYTERAVRFIEENRERSFFLYFPQPMVHKPLAVSGAFYGKTGTGLYGDALAELDWSVGRVLQKLDELKLSQRTLVLFSSDNGPWFGGSSGGLRGMKAQAFEGGLRVPLLARMPKTIPAGLVSDAPAAIIDLFPTVLKAAGVDVPTDRPIDGRDLRPLLTTPGAATPHEFILAFNARGQAATVREGRWKLHVGGPYGRVKMPADGSRWIDPRGPDGVTILAPYEQPQPSEFPGVESGDPIDGPTLFDLAADAAEQKNVAAEHADVVARLKGYVRQFEREVPPPPKRERVNPPTAAAARAAGEASTGLVLHPRRRTPVAGGFEVAEVEERWKPAETCVIVCDMWDAHHCLNAVRRSVEMAPRMDAFLKAARDRGALVIHAPSSCMQAYEDTPGRKLATSAPTATNLPPDIDRWCRHIPAEDGGVYPLDQSDSEDDDPDEHRKWHEELAARGRNPKAPWVRQMEHLTIADGDAISDSGVEIWNLQEARGIKNVILLGVHTNMCVLGRPFGLRQMAKNGRRVVLVRDLTDTMYNPKQRPFVSHFQGTDLIVEHIEKFVCPTITSVDLLGGEPFRFSADKRPVKP